MGRPANKVFCPYNSDYCHGYHPEGDMICARCYDDLMESEFGVEFATAEEAEIEEKEKERGFVSSSEEGGEGT